MIPKSWVTSFFTALLESTFVSMKYCANQLFSLVLNKNGLSNVTFKPINFIHLYKRMYGGILGRQHYPLYDDIMKK